MKILHLYNPDDAHIAHHVRLLAENDCINDVLTSVTSQQQPDIVHMHGCQNAATAHQARRLMRGGARLVLSPHHQLMPWATAAHRVGGKMPAQAMWQRSLCSHGYCLVASGAWEERVLQQLGWNARIETVADAALTQTITPADMTRRMNMLYRKVIDSNPAELLSDAARRLLPIVLKVGIAGDARWSALPSSELHALSNSLTTDDWRHIFIYMHHSQLANIFAAGLALLRLPVQTIDASRIDVYLPDMPQPKAPAANDIQQLLSQIRASMKSRRLSYGTLVRLTQLLRDDQLNEERLMADLRQHKLDALLASTLPLLAETTLLDEGFMPCAPTDTHQTAALRRALAHHLAI